MYLNTRRKTMRGGVCRASSDGCFTHNSLLALCKGNEEVCQDLFYSLEWTYPTTLLEEWDSNGYFDEIEGWYDD